MTSRTEDAAQTVAAVHAATSLAWAGPGWCTAPVPGAVPSALPPGELWRPASIRSFAPETPAVDLVAEVLVEAYAAFDGRRNVPSAGALYPLRFQLLGTGGGPLLEWTLSGSIVPVSAETIDGAAVRRVLFEQVEGSAWILFLSADPSRCVARYGARAYRFLLIEAGMAAQEVIRACAQRDLSVCPLGAFDDDAARALLGFELLPHLPLLAMAVGRPRIR